MEEPNRNDKDSLLKEVIEDESFGISDKAETLIVVDLPDYMVESILKDIHKGEAEVEKHNHHADEG